MPLLVRVVASWAIPVLSLIGQTMPTVNINARLVRIPVSAFDRTGAPLKGLEAGDFVVFDNGIRQEITTFWSDSDAPLAVGLVLDTSGSQLPHLIENSRVLADFLQTVLRPQDKAFLQVFDFESRLAIDTTGSPTEFRSMLSRFSHREGDHPHEIGSRMGEPCVGRQHIAGAPCGNSVVWKAVATASEKLSHMEGRRVILLITDGEDSGSDVSLKDAIKAAQAADVAVFPLGFPDPFHRKINRSDLERLAKSTGGSAMLKQKDPKADFTALNETLHSEYVLTFKPLPSLNNGSTHTLDVRVAGAKRIIARSSYSEPPFSASEQLGKQDQPRD